MELSKDETGFLEDLLLPFRFNNSELSINHTDCPVYNFFWGATVYLYDFPEGILRSNFELSEKAVFGVWNNNLEDNSYLFTRERYGCYTVNCLEEEILGVCKGSICSPKTVLLSRTTMKELANSLKKTILGFLNENGLIAIQDILKMFYSWNLIEPQSAQQLKEWRKARIW